MSSEDVKQKDKDKMATDASEQQQSTSTAKPSAQGRHDEMRNVVTVMDL